MSANAKRTFFILLGIALFFAFYLAPQFDPAIDPSGKAFELSQEGKAAIGLFLLAGIWWVFGGYLKLSPSVLLVLLSVLFRHYS